jgi:hypothetical protein
MTEPNFAIPVRIPEMLSGIDLYRRDEACDPHLKQLFSSNAILDFYSHIHM